MTKFLWDITHDIIQAIKERKLFLLSIIATLVAEIMTVLIATYRVVVDDERF